MSDCCKWEADHQRAALERHGLADEFPFGCDAIDHVAEALVGARAEIERLRLALGFISLGQGPYNRDPLKHAFNCISALKQIALDALEGKPWEGMDDEWFRKQAEAQAMRGGAG